MAGDDPARWAALTVHAISYGGLLAGGLEAGETLLVSGATGNLGSSAVAVALAMGAGRVLAPGRNQAMGGVGMLGGEDLALPYPWIMRNSITVRGQWMYPRTANVGIIRLLASGTLDLAPERVRSFGLDAVNDAIAYAAAHGGPFDRTSLIPSAG